MTSTTLPGEQASSTTSKSYTNWCAATGAQTPCVEVDTAQRLSGSTTVTSRTFYDGHGRAVETRSPGPGNQDVVSYTYYDPMGRVVFTSNPYYVIAYTGQSGPSAFATPDASQPGASTTYTNQRTSSVTDALGHTTQTLVDVTCNPMTGDSGCYVRTRTVDALSHQTTTVTDAWGRTDYTRTYTGTFTGGLSAYATTTDTYDANGNLTQVLHPDLVTKTMFAYDSAGRQTSLTDPDRGSETYSYDANGNSTESVDARGASGTIYAGYDGLNRQLWRNSTNSSNGAYVTYSYGTPLGATTALVASPTRSSMEDQAGRRWATGSTRIPTTCVVSRQGGPHRSMEQLFLHLRLQ